MNRLFVIGAASVMIAGLIGCGGSGNGITNTPNPRVRLANVMPGIASLQGQVGDDIITSGLAFGAVSDYRVTDNGNKDLTVGDSTLDNLASIDDTLFETEKRYTGIAWGETGSRALIKFQHNKDATANATTGIRLINAAQGAGGVDVYISAPADPLPGSPAFTNVTEGSISDHSIVVAVPGNNNYRIRVYPTGTTTTAIVDETIVVEERARVAVVLYQTNVALVRDTLLLDETLD